MFINLAHNMTADPSSTKPTLLLPSYQMCSSCLFLTHQCKNALHPAIHSHIKPCKGRSASKCALYCTITDFFIASSSVAASTGKDVQCLASVDMRILPHNLACSSRRDILEDMAQLGTCHNTGVGPQDYAAELDIL